MDDDEGNLLNNNTELVFPTNNQGMVRIRTVDDLYREILDDDKNYLPEDKELKSRRKKLVEKYYLKMVVVVKKTRKKKKNKKEEPGTDAEKRTRRRCKSKGVNLRVERGVNQGKENDKYIINL